MSPLPAVHQFLPSLIYGDAIGNHALLLQRQLRSWGYASEIYAAHCDARCRRLARDYRRYHDDRHDLLIYHYSIGSPITTFVAHLAGRLIINYHNVTPAPLMGHHSPQFQAVLAQGRAQLAELRSAELGVAVSDYNRAELLSLGFPNVVTVPVMIDFERLAGPLSGPAQALAERFAGDGVKILFVGRLVPSKRQTDLISLLAAYQHGIDAGARLLLVGTAANAPTYPLELEAQAAALGVEHVEFLGQLTDAELAACYRVATVFVSLSEHEGLGVPLLEAMYCHVPVLAYAAAAVADTLGLSGILIRRKHYGILAETVALVAGDPVLRARLIEAQARQVAAFSPQAVAARWQQILAELQ